MQIEKFRLKAIRTGEISLDGGAMFGVIPKVMWNKPHPADEKNRIKLAMNSLLIEFENKKILVDTGVGTKTAQKFNDIYSINPLTNIEQALLAENIKPEEITDVILTHLHFDHAGGATKKVNADIIPTFPNAKYYVQKKQFDWGMSPTDRDGASYFKENYSPLNDLSLIEFTEGDQKLFDGIEVIEVNGHTPSQQLVKISDGKTSLLYAADFLPTAEHIPFPYIMGYDLFPMTTLAEKKRLFHRMHEENWYIFFEHDINFNIAKLDFNEKGYFPSDKTNIESLS